MSFSLKSVSFDTCSFTGTWMTGHDWMLESAFRSMPSCPNKVAMTSVGGVGGVSALPAATTVHGWVYRFISISFSLSLCIFYTMSWCTLFSLHPPFADTEVLPTTTTGSTSVGLAQVPSNGSHGALGLPGATGRQLMWSWRYWIVSSCRKGAVDLLPQFCSKYPTAAASIFLCRQFDQIWLGILLPVVTRCQAIWAC